MDELNGYSLKDGESVVNEARPCRADRSFGGRGRY